MEKFARGRSSEAFRLEDGRVLKLFFEDYPEEYAKKEFSNTKIASELGCTSMKVYEMIKQDNRNGIIMDYIDGISQNDMPTKNPLYLLKGGKISLDRLDKPDINNSDDGVSYEVSDVSDDDNDKGYEGFAKRRR